MTLSPRRRDLLA